MAKTLSGSRTPPGAQQTVLNERRGSPPFPRRAILGKPETGAARWMLALAVFTAVMASSLGLKNVFLSTSWLPPATLVVALTLLPPATIRRYPKLSPFAPIAAFMGWSMGLTLAFFSDTAFWAVVPTERTLTAAQTLVTEAVQTITISNTPMPAESGATFIFCAGLGLTALIIDTLAIAVALPGASIIALLPVLLPAALTTQDGIGTPGLVGTAIGYLLILGSCRWYAPEGKLRAASNRAASGTLVRATVLTVAVLLVSLMVTALIPGFNSGLFPQGSRVGQPVGTAGLDPMVSLGNDLRAQSAAVDLNYWSTSDTALYLRMSTLEDFSGKTWKPSPQPSGPPAALSRLSPQLPWNPELPATSNSAFISVVNLASPWLPTLANTTSVQNLSGDWTWNARTETVHTFSSSTTAQKYVVTAKGPALTKQMLQDSSPTLSDAVDPIFTKLPDNVPAIIKKTEEQITAGKNTPYDRAMAIQNYLRSPAFSYSERTPVDKGYDGSGMDVLAKFLEVKAGYCVHFSATMAVMARLAGIPSRIAVGFAPGSATNQPLDFDGLQGQAFQATGRDAHAWPELYFEGLGWVPFEPTPSRGAVPSYAQPLPAPSEDPNNNDLLNGSNTNATPSATATPTETTMSSAAASDAANVAATGAQLLSWLGVVLIVLAALASPAVTREMMRRRRLTAVREAGNGPGTRNHGPSNISGLGNRRSAHGKAEGLSPESLAWRELLDTATDYGFVYDPSLTPAMQGIGISAMLGPGPCTDVNSVRSAYESWAFGPPAVSAAVSAAQAPTQAPAERLRSELPEQDWGELADAVERIHAGLRDRASTWGRIRAVLLPSSFFHRNS